MRYQDGVGCNGWIIGMVLWGKAYAEDFFYQLTSNSTFDDNRL